VRDDNADHQHAAAEGHSDDARKYSNDSSGSGWAIDDAAAVAAAAGADAVAAAVVVALAGTDCLDDVDAAASDQHPMAHNAVAVAVAPHNADTATVAHVAASDDSRQLNAEIGSRYPHSTAAKTVAAVVADAMVYCDACHWGWAEAHASHHASAAANG